MTTQRHVIRILAMSRRWHPCRDGNPTVSCTYVARVHPAYTRKLVIWNSRWRRRRHLVSECWGYILVHIAYRARLRQCDIHRTKSEEEIGSPPSGRKWGNAMCVCVSVIKFRSVERDIGRRGDRKEIDDHFPVFIVVKLTHPHVPRVSLG